MQDPRNPVTRALISLSDKTGAVALAEALAARGVELLSTGGTAKLLRGAGLPVRDVSELTGFPEMMDGRVKTLHPKVHGGLLGRLPEDALVMAEHGILPIDLLVVNLYPFAQVLARGDADLDELVENIDIGGPAMLRAAAKNHARVTVLTDPADYPRLIESLAAGGTTLADRRSYAAKAYAHTAAYDGRVAEWLGAVAEGGDAALPPTLHASFVRREALRYGENPHQSAALYVASDAPSGVVATSRFRQGKTLSFNNYADADAALESVRLFDAPACVIVKHLNPCGVAVASSAFEAYDRAYATDPVSAFGGIIAFNRLVDGALAAEILKRQFVEVVVAPDYDATALEVFAGKPNVRVLSTGELRGSPTQRDFRRLAGALLVQDSDRDGSSAGDWKIVSRRAPSADELRDLAFAWTVAMQVKSNAIVYARSQRTIGIGAGQMSRVVSAKIAGWKATEAGLTVPGSVMASDAFFPFRDGIDAAHDAGIVAVIQPGGSMRDAEVIAAADEHGMAMVFTGIRHFRH